MTGSPRGRSRSRSEDHRTIKRPSIRFRDKGRKTKTARNEFLASSTLNDMFTHFEQLRYLDFYTLIKLSVILPHGVCKIPRKF
jgi:hypothetical protein